MSFLQSRGLFALVLVVILAGWAGPAVAERARMTVRGEPGWSLVADEITGDQKAGIYEARGEVVITRGPERLEADYVRLHDETNTAEARGHVVFSSAEFKLVCQSLVFNLDQSVGKFYHGTVYFPENHYYLSGDEIEKTGPETFYILQGRATTCDGPTPAWTLSGRDITVRREGYATATHATFATRFFPLLYTPYLKIPVKDRRQSGVLMPEFQSSERDGQVVHLPLYWAISDSKDLTVHLTSMTYRGLNLGLEFRYKDWGGEGVYRLDYLNDQEPPTITRPDYEPELQRHRYWFRGKSDAETKSGFRLAVDLDYVSDPEYLYEFSRGFTGYYRTRDQFLEEMGRDLADPDDPLRENQVLLSRAVGDVQLDMAFEYTDDLNDPKNLETLQRLPRINLGLPRTALGGTPLFFKTEASYTYFSRKTLSEGHRWDIYPQLFWPLQFFGWLDVEPAAGFRETVYLPHGLEEADRNDAFNSRELWGFSVEASTNLRRVFDLGWGRVEKVQHRLKPELGYETIWHKFQEDLPRFDGRDRIPEKEVVRYGVVNYLVAKVRRGESFPRAREETTEGGEPAGGEEAGPEFDYHEFLRFSLARTYDLVEAERTLRLPRRNRPLDEHWPHGPWELELDLSFGRWFGAQMESKYDTYLDKFVYHTLGFTARDGRGDSLTVEYDYRKEYNHQAQRYRTDQYEDLSYVFNLVLNPETTLAYERRQSLLGEVPGLSPVSERSSEESIYSLTYKPQCWAMTLQYVDRPGDRSIAVIFSLLGMGQVGTVTYTPGTPYFWQREQTGF